MAPKADIVSQAVAAIQAGEAQVMSDAIGAAVDEAALEQKASDGTLTQADLDAAVKAASDPLNAQIAALQAQDASDAKAASDAQAALSDAQSQLASAQASVSDLTAKLEADDAAVNGLKSSMAALQSADQQLQAVLAALAGLGQPAAPAS